MLPHILLVFDLRLFGCRRKIEVTPNVNLIPLQVLKYILENILRISHTF